NAWGDRRLQRIAEDPQGPFKVEAGLRQVRHHFAMFRHSSTKSAWCLSRNGPASTCAVSPDSLRPWQGLRRLQGFALFVGADALLADSLRSPWPLWTSGRFGASLMGLATLEIVPVLFPAFDARLEVADVGIAQLLHPVGGARAGLAVHARAVDHDGRVLVRQ